jgi:hypothetical protein
MGLQRCMVLVLGIVLVGGAGDTLDTLELLMPGVTTEAPDAYRAIAVTIPPGFESSFVGASTWLNPHVRTPSRLSSRA